eukprot:2077243-Amphidinium_carterae.2
MWECRGRLLLHISTASRGSSSVAMHTPAHLVVASVDSTVGEITEVRVVSANGSDNKAVTNSSLTLPGKYTGCLEPL